MSYIKTATSQLKADEIADLTARASLINIVIAGVIACLIAL